MKWIDKTSYSRDAKERTPSVLELDECMFRVHVHRWLNDKTSWYMSCTDLNFEKVRLTSSGLEKAQREAVDRIHDQLVRMLASLKKACPA